MWRSLTWIAIHVNCPITEGVDAVNAGYQIYPICINIHCEKQKTRDITGGR